MNSFVIGVATSVVASALVYLLLAAMEALSPALRLGVIAVVLVVGVVLAWLVSRNARREGGAGTAVGDRIDAAGDVTVERADVESSGGDTRVGTNLKSGGAVRVSDVRVTRGKGSE